MKHASGATIGRTAKPSERHRESRSDWIVQRHGGSGASGSLAIMSAWDAGAPGVLSLPSGRLVRGRGLRRPLLDGTLPEFGLYLLNKRPESVSWEAWWVRWPDSRLPTDRRDAQDALREA